MSTSPVVPANSFNAWNMSQANRMPTATSSGCEVSPVSTEPFSLIEIGDEGLPALRFVIPEGVCEVGRATEAEIRIPSGSVSKRHARLICRDGNLSVEDLGSTNGTFVNGRRVERCVLVRHDRVQFASSLFRVDVGAAERIDRTVSDCSAHWAQTLITFDTLISQRRVVPHFQPIVALTHRDNTGFELLARSDLRELASPAALFAAAERLGQQASLSELMRSEGMRVAERRGDRGMRYYLNTHPAEVVNARLIDSVRSLRREQPSMKITIEIHEAAVTSIAAMRNFRDTLRELDMDLAYDDFGAGQGRLRELSEVPPDVLKFDMQLIRDIDSATPARQEMLRSLVRIALDLGSVPLAEGVETEAEHAVCKELGFQLGQGYLYGRPQPFADPRV